MQTLLYNDDGFPSLAAGLRSVTIRYGLLHIRSGSLKFEGTTDKALDYTVDVHSVQWLIFRDLGNVENAGWLAGAGFTDIDDALRQLREFYPDLDMDSEVTVVEWPRG